MENNTAFGTPSFGNEARPRYKFFKILQPKGDERTSVILRILPPIKSLAPKGKWSCFHANHFGYSGLNPRDPAKLKMRPFGCIKKDSKGMTTVSCPACDEYDRLDALFRSKEAALANAPDNTALAEDVQGMKDWLRWHNNDRKHHLNVMDPDGEFGVLAISHTVKKMLDAQMESLRNPKPNSRGVVAKPRDPISVGESVWFNFTRMGKFPVQDNVEVYKEEDDDGAARIVPAIALTDQQVAQALETLPDLALDVVRYISADQITAIVAAKGDPELVDKAWGSDMSFKNAPEPRTVVPPTAYLPEPKPTVTGTTDAPKFTRRDTIVSPTVSVEVPTKMATATPPNQINEEFFAQFRKQTAKPQP